MAAVTTDTLDGPPLCRLVQIIRNVATGFMITISLVFDGMLQSVINRDQKLIKASPT